MEVDEAVDWGMEDEYAPNESGRRGFTQNAYSEDTANSPPRTEMDEDAISLGGNDDDTEALMNYRGGADVDSLKPILNSATSTSDPGRRKPTSLGNVQKETERRERVTETRKAVSPQYSPRGRSTANRLPVPPANVGLPPRPNFESTQRVRNLNQSTWLPWTLSSRNTSVSGTRIRIATVIATEVEIETLTVIGIGIASILGTLADILIGTILANEVVVRSLDQLGTMLSLPKPVLQRLNSLPVGRRFLLVRLGKSIMPTRTEKYLSGNLRK
jgi:hypothetical protein